MQRRLIPLGFALVMIAIMGCAGANAASESSTHADAAADSSRSASSGSSDSASDEGAIGAAPVGRELPPELVAELRMQGSDADGRLVTLAPGFIATAECSDCGAPSYLWFLAVRCEDSHHCTVLTEQCEGEITREQSVFQLEFRPVEGVSTPEVCAGYSGTFELP